MGRARGVLAGLMAVVCWITCLDPAYATENGGAKYRKEGDRTSVEVDITAASHPPGVYKLGPAFRVADINVDFGSTLSAELFACDLEDADANGNGTVDAEAGCVSLTAITADVALTDVRITRRHLILDVNTAEGASTVSRLTMFGSFTVGGSGGVVGSGTLAEMNAYQNPQAGDLWQQTDDDGTGDCATDGGTDSALLCQYDAAATAWVPAGIAGGTDNLGNHTATTDLDLDGNDVIGAANVESKTRSSRLFYASAYADDADIDSINTYGIREALAACATAGGGRVVLPPGRTTMALGAGGICGVSACTSPVIKLPAVDRGDGVEVGSCELVGFGSGAEEVGSGGTATPTDLRFTGISSMTATHGVRTLIQATAQGQVLRDFHITTTNPDSVTYPIWVASDEASPGDTGIDFLLIENVKIRDSAAGDLGYGIVLTNTEKGTIRDVNIEQVGTGILIDEPPTNAACTASTNPWDCCTGSGTGTCSGGRNNAMRIESTRIASGGTGISIETRNACESINLFGVVVEGNTSGGLTIDAGADCQVNDFGGWWENSSPANSNVLNNSANATYVSWGARYGGSATYSFRQSIAHASNVLPSTLVAPEHGNQIAGVTGGKVRLISPSILQESGTRNLGANVSGGSLHVVDAGQSCGTHSIRGVTGDLCYEPDNNELYVCEASGTATICNTAGEWIPLRPKLDENYTWTGNHDIITTTLEIPNSTTLPATCAVGQVYMDTDATSGQRIYACESANTWALQGDGGGGGGGGYATVDDEDTPLTQRTTINFEGAGVTCADDTDQTTCTIPGGSGSAIVLDIGDDGGDDSLDVAEIATTGDTNGIVSEPSADKLLINMGNDWPKADLADALAANGANCSAGSFAAGVDASGAAEGCTDLATQAELDAKTLPGSQTDNRLVRTDGTGGDIQASGITVDDSNSVSGLADVTATGTGTFDSIVTGDPGDNARAYETLANSTSLGTPAANNCRIGLVGATVATATPYYHCDGGTLTAIGGGGSGDITAVGPAFASGAAFTDGVASTGTTMLVWEGTTVDGNELSLLAPSADPGVDINVTLPSASSTLPIFGQQVTFSGPTASRTVTLPDADFTAARTDAAQSFTGTQTFGSATSILLGTAGSTVGSIGFRNATSGTITMQPLTGALGTITQSLPPAAGTLQINNFASTASSAGTLTMNASSQSVQRITGTTTHTVQLPSVSASGMTAGRAWTIANDSTGLVTVNSSGGNAVAVLATGRRATFIANATSGTDASVWTVVGTRWSGTTTLNPGAISAGTCASAITATATGLATTDIITWTPTTDITSVNGYDPSSNPGIQIVPYPTANTVNFKLCNPTAGSITPGSIAVNWAVVQ